VAGGEIDILALDGTTRVAVEVRTRIGGDDPADAAGYRKRQRLARLARAAGADRRDIIGIRLNSGGFEVHWVPSC
jgi:Holliday junction resolvase-like predicted endonuclease